MQTIPLDEINLAQGSHGPEWCGEACAVEVANLIAAGRVTCPPALLRCERPLEPAPFADDHPSISRVIRSFVIALNDAWDDEDRQRLRPYAARILCTRTTDADDQVRGLMAADWLIRTYTPTWLRLAGLESEASGLEALPEVVDGDTLTGSLDALNRARESADAARDAAWDAARDAAWDAARDAARDAAWAAAWAAARGAAWAAARGAARDAAWAAARAAAGGALAPTVRELQASALQLLDRMIEVSP